MKKHLIQLHSPMIDFLNNPNNSMSSLNYSNDFANNSSDSLILLMTSFINFANDFTIDSKRSFKWPMISWLIPLIHWFHQWFRHWFRQWFHHWFQSPMIPMIPMIHWFCQWFCHCFQSLIPITNDFAIDSDH